MACISLSNMHVWILCKIIWMKRMYLIPRKAKQIPK